MIDISSKPYKNLAKIEQSVKRKRRPNSVKRSDFGTKRSSVKTVIYNDGDYPDLFPSFEELQKDLAETLKDIAKFEEREALAPVRKEAKKRYHRERVRAKGYNRSEKHNAKRAANRLEKLPSDLICKGCNEQKLSANQFVRCSNDGDMICRSCFSKLVKLIKG